MLHFKFSSDDLKIDETNNILTNIRSSSFKNNTGFIGNWIDLGSEETESKVLTIRINKLSSESCFFIGLAPSDEHTANVSMEMCCPKSYGFCGNGKIYFDDKELKTVDDCTENDVLYFSLNVQSKCLSLRINENPQMVLFSDILPTKYKYAVSLCYSGDECAIIDHNIGDKEPTPEPIEQSDADNNTESQTSSPKETDEILPDKQSKHGVEVEEKEQEQEEQGVEEEEAGIANEDKVEEQSSGCSCYIL